MTDLFGGDMAGTDDLARALAGRGTRSGVAGPCEAFTIHGVKRATPRALLLDLGPRLMDAPGEAAVWLADELVAYERDGRGGWQVLVPVWKAQEVGLL